MSRLQTKTIVFSGVLLLVVILGVANLVRMRTVTDPAPSPKPSPSPDTASEPPKKVPPERIMQTYQVGRTYRSVMTFKLNGRGMQRDWGITVNTNLLYYGEVEILRTIKSNDGETIVLDQTFARAENVRVATQLENISFDDLGVPGELALAALDWFGEKEWNLQHGWAQGTREGLQFIANQQLFKDFLSRVATDATAKVMAKVEDLQGKSVEIRWVNGKIAHPPTSLTPPWTPSPDQESFIESLSMTSDTNILPDPESKPGAVWSINGRDLVPCLDPSLHAALAGRVNVERSQDATTQGIRYAVIQTQPNGHLEMRGYDDAHAYLGDWYPEGQMQFSFKDNIVTSAKFRGGFSAHQESTDHWFFKAEFTVTPEYNITYTCELKP